MPSIRKFCFPGHRADFRAGVAVALTLALSACGSAPKATAKQAVKA